MTWVVRQRLFLVSQVLLLLTAVATAVATSRTSDWRPVGLVLLFGALTLLSDLAIIETRGQRLSGSFIALVLAMAFCGPGPAMAIALVAMVVDALRARVEPALILSNFATYAAFPVVGGLLARTELVAHDDAAFGLVVFAVYGITLLLNFGLVAIGVRIRRGIPLQRQVHEVLVPILPAEAAEATLVLACAIAYIAAGTTALAVAGIALVAFQFLTVALLQSQERAEQLTERTEELAALQIGVLVSLVQTLSLRDKMTARHSAAVARYARAIARAVGATPEEQELVHTAGLLHDIGKFIFPDRILFAESRLSEEDWEIVRRHPTQGARVVARVAGYGPVAEIIRCHHERPDGTGYPAGLSGEAIPRLSRMISVADTFDVMTARDSYRKPVSRELAFAELRRVAGTQLDGELVEAFITLLTSRDVSFQHTSDADFEAELDFDARVRAIANS